MDGGIHKASVLAHLAGRPNQVYAVEVPPGVPGLEAEDGIVVTTRSPDGVVGIINFTWASRQAGRGYLDQHQRRPCESLLRIARPRPPLAQD